jgi:hypothetical protein
LEAERRTLVRYTSTLEISCSRVENRDGMEWPGRVVNISAAGVGLMLRRRFPAGTLVSLGLKTGAGGSVQVVEVRVVHATAIKDDGTSCWLHGCVFTRELMEADMLALLSADASDGSLTQDTP